MTTGGTAVFVRTLREFANPKLVVVYLLGVTAVAGAIGFVLADGMPDQVGSLHLYAQEQHLTEAFVQLAFVWGAGIPAMVIVAVLGATAIARERQQGTLQILLSKPVSRRSVLLGKAGAIVVFTLSLMIVGLLISGSALLVAGDISPAAVSGSIFAMLPGSLLYALVVAVILGGIATLIATLTGRLLWAVLGTLVLPAAFFGSIFIRLLAPTPLYEQYFLYIIDISYHFGNLFVLVNDLIGTTFSPSTQQALDTLTGTYDTAGSGIDPLVGGMAGSVPLAGYVPTVVSAGILLAVGIAALVGAVVWFDRIDL